MARSHFCHGEWLPGTVDGCPDHNHRGALGHLPGTSPRFKAMKELERDHAAYREARRNGLQPEQMTRDSIYREERYQESFERAVREEKVMVRDGPS